MRVRFQSAPDLQKRPNRSKTGAQRRQTSPRSRPTFLQRDRCSKRGPHHPATTSWSPPLRESLCRWHARGEHLPPFQRAAAAARWQTKGERRILRCDGGSLESHQPRAPGPGRGSAPGSSAKGS
jgi:hypothetical protein